ncbi:MAG: YfhO family protein [Candidatus Saccharicenans sp.]
MKIEFEKKDWLGVELFILIFLSFFFSFFFQGKTFYERDSTLLEMPLRMHGVELLKEGNLALWTESHGNGQPYLANPKMAIFYPTTWLYLILPFFVAFKIHYLIHPIIGWLGMFLLAKSYGLSRKASFFASSLFFLSGMYLSSFEFYNHIAAMAWMMWVLLLQRLNKPIKSFGFAAYVLAWALLILAGAPEFIIIAGLLTIGQLFFEPKKLSQLRTDVIKVALAGVLAVLIAAAQLLPSLELLQQTERTEHAKMWPLELAQMVELVIPHFLGDDRQPGHNDFWGGHLFNTWYPLYYSLYVGFGALLLLLWALIHLKERKEKILALEIIFFFLLSCGKYSPFFFLYEKISFLSSIRFPVKFFMGSLFCGVILVGMAVDKLKQSEPGKRFTLIVLACAAGLSLIYILFKSDIINSLSTFFVISKESSKKLLSGSIIFGLCSLFFYALIFLLIRRLKNKRQVLIIILIIACLADPAYNNRYINPTVSESFFNRPAILEKIGTPAIIYRDITVPFIPGVDDVAKLRMFSYYRNSLFPFSGIPYGIKYVFNGDFIATYPTSQKEVLKKVSDTSLVAREKALKYVGCEYYIASKPLFHPEKAEKLMIEGYPVYLEKLSEKKSWPLLVGEIIKINSLDESIGIFCHPEFNPDKIAIISQSALNDGNLEGLSIYSDWKNYLESKSLHDIELKGEVCPIKELNGFGRYLINVNKPALAVFPGNYLKGWKAWIDGKRTPVFEVNLFTKGVIVPAGQHVVVLKYLPDSFLVGGVISILTLLFIIAFYVYIYFISRKNVFLKV